MLVLEAGPRDWHPFIHIPAGFIKTYSDPRVNWLYKMEPSEWTGGRRIPAPRGKTLGGSSSINGHIYNRGQRMDFDTWAQLGNRGWGYADVLPYFRRMERRLGDGDATYRGRDGSLTVSDIDWRHPLCDAFIEGATTPRHPAQSRLQRRDPGRRVPTPSAPSRRAAASAPRARSCSPRCAGPTSMSSPTRTPPRSCSKAAAPRAFAIATAAARRTEGGPRPPRGDPLRRLLQFAPAPPAFGHRPARTCCNRSAFR